MPKPGRNEMIVIYFILHDISHIIYRIIIYHIWLTRTSDVHVHVLPHRHFAGDQGEYYFLDFIFFFVHISLSSASKSLKDNHLGISYDYGTVSSAIWQIFYEILIFCNLLHEPWGKWNKNEIWEASKILIIVIRSHRAITSLLLAHESMQGMQNKWKENISAKFMIEFISTTFFC